MSEIYLVIHRSAVRRRKRRDAVKSIVMVVAGGGIALWALTILRILTQSWAGAK